MILPILLACAMADGARDTASTGDSSGTRSDTVGTSWGPGDLLITELMMDPAAVDGDFGEWIEVRNLSGSAIDLEGLTVADSDDDGFVVDRPLSVTPGGYAIFAPDADPTRNGGLTVDFAYPIDTVKLDNEADRVTLMRDEVLLDVVAYDANAFPIAEGASTTLGGDAMSPEGNDIADRWCLATSPYGDGDLGTPGTVNDPC